MARTRYTVIPYTAEGAYGAQRRGIAKSKIPDYLRGEQEYQQLRITFAVIYEEGNAPRSPIGVAVRGKIGWTVRLANQK